MTNVRNIHIFVCEECPTSFFYMWLSSCASTICWNVYSFLISPLILAPLSWYSCWESAHHRHMGLFLDSISMIYMSFFQCSSSWLLLLFSKFWNREVWFFQLCPSNIFKIILTIFWVTSISIWVLGSDCQISAKKIGSWDSEKGCGKYADQFWDYCHQNNVKSPSPWAWDIFPFV